jgi:hypothetical protein
LIFPGQISRFRAFCDLIMIDGFAKTRSPAAGNVMTY